MRREHAAHQARPRGEQRLAVRAQDRGDDQHDERGRERRREGVERPRELGREAPQRVVVGEGIVQERRLESRQIEAPGEGLGLVRRQLDETRRQS